MLKQNGKRFYKGLYDTFKLAPDLKIIFFISSTCEEHTNKAQLHKQERNIEHIYIIYIIGLVFIF